MRHESSIYVASYVLADVVRSLFAEAMYVLDPNRKPMVSITLVVLLIELTKMFAAFIIVMKTTRNFSLRDLRYFVMPAGLYFINNCLYYGALTDASVGGLSLLMHIRLPLTAVAHHLMVKKQKSWRAWTSLAFVFVGVSFAQLSEGFVFTNARVVLVTFIICFNSSVASVVTERTLKTLRMPFWDQQLRMYFFGVVPSAIGVVLSSMRGKELLTLEELKEGVFTTSSAAWLSTVGCVISGAGSGILTGLVIYRLDTVVKVVSNSLITVLVTLASYAIFGVFPFVPLNFGIGSLILAVASYAYASFVSSSERKTSSMSSTSINLPLISRNKFPSFHNWGVQARIGVPVRAMVREGSNIFSL